MLRHLKSHQYKAGVAPLIEIRREALEIYGRYKLLRRGIV